METLKVNDALIIRCKELINGRTHIQNILNMYPLYAANANRFAKSGIGSNYRRNKDSFKKTERQLVRFINDSAMEKV